MTDLDGRARMALLWAALLFSAIVLPFAYASLVSFGTVLDALQGAL